MLKRTNPSLDANQRGYGAGLNQHEERPSGDLPVSPPVQSSGRQTGLGDSTCTLAQRYGERCNQTEFATSLRDGVLAKERYLGYIAACYPIVVGFNRGLVSSMPKVDHVRESDFLNKLARQLQEEQYHNGLWRSMLSAFSIDHAALYHTLEEYMARFAPAELDRMTEGVLAALRADLQNIAPGVFPDPVRRQFAKPAALREILCLLESMNYIREIGPFEPLKKRGEREAPVTK